MYLASLIEEQNIILGATSIMDVIDLSFKNWYYNLNMSGLDP